MNKASAALAAAVMLLAGCGGDAKPDTSTPTTTGSSPATTTPAPTTSASPTASPTTDPNIPAAARAHTPAGAEAFVRYFYSQLNVAWSKPQAGLISRLSATTCKTCHALEATAADLAAKHQRYRGDAFAVGTVGSLGESEVLVVGEQPPGAVIDIKGSIVKSTTKAQPVKFVVAVSWSSESWRIQEIRVLK